MRALAVFICALSLLPIAASSDAVNLDGHWWQGASTDQKLGAVQGSEDSYIEGFDDGLIYASVALKATEQQIVQMRRAEPTFTHTFAYYEAGLTDFYNLHPTAQAASVGEVMACLADNAMYTCDQVAKRQKQR